MSVQKTPKQDNVIFKKKKGFTQVQNWATDDMALSDKALGLYTRIQRWITYDAEDFVCSKAFIRTKTPSGEKAFDSAWNELKEKGYLKMYCVPPATWTAELLDEPKPDDPHTFYLNTEGEINSTNIDRAKKKAAKLNAAKESEYYPQNGGNTPNPEYYPQKRGNTNSSNTNRDNTNGGNNLNNKNNTLNKDSNNTIYPSTEDETKSGVDNFDIEDGLIDNALISQIKEQIEYEHLLMHNRFPADELDAIVHVIAVFKTASKSMEISGSTYSPDVVRERADSINAEHVEYVFECLQNNSNKISNIVNYLKTSVFNAPVSIGPYYANMVRSDRI